MMRNFVRSVSWRCGLDELNERQVGTSEVRRSPRIQMPVKAIVSFLMPYLYRLNGKNKEFRDEVSMLACG